MRTKQCPRVPPPYPVGKLYSSIVRNVLVNGLVPVNLQWSEEKDEITFFSPGHDNIPSLPYHSFAFMRHLWSTTSSFPGVPPLAHSLLLT